MRISRRHLVTTATVGALLPRAALAASPKEITWDDLIEPGVPYSEIIGEGEIDAENDRWLPEFDENGTKLNAALDGAYVKLPGYIIPWDVSSAGVTSFILVPYVGACIHVPPPPPNQLIFVMTETPWPSDDLWEAVWVTGTMRHEFQATELADIGYSLEADEMEVFEWEDNG
ncbi:MAG: DUF3299 domain-containing protein [Roseobacter sp.]